MDLTQGINAVMLCFLAVGGADYLLGGRFGLGKEFEEGIVTCGRLLLVMAGFMVLAPLIARGLGPVVSPLFHAMGVDPSILAGIMLANDSGGLPLALELADTQEAGLFSVLIVGSMLGTTVMLGIPTIMMFATQAERPSVIYGLLCGLVTIPLGCLAGGLAAGFRTELVVRNSAPVLVLSVVLLVLLLLLKERIVPVFSAFGKMMTAVSIFGLVCGAAESLLGITVFPGMGTLEEVFPVVGSIAVFLGGAFTLVAVVRRVFAAALGRAGRLLRINDSSVSALILSLANSLAAILMIHEMDDRGRLLNIAFLTSAGCALGDHLAYTNQIAPELCAPVMVGKLVGGISALAAALLLAKRLPLSAGTGQQAERGSAADELMI